MATNVIEDKEILIGSDLMKNCQMATLFGELVWISLTCTNGVTRRRKSGEATSRYVHQRVYIIQKGTDLFLFGELVWTSLTCKNGITRRTKSGKQHRSMCKKAFMQSLWTSWATLEDGRAVALFLSQCFQEQGWSVPGGQCKITFTCKIREDWMTGQWSGMNVFNLPSDQ